MCSNSDRMEISFIHVSVQRAITSRFHTSKLATDSHRCKEQGNIGCSRTKYLLHAGKYWRQLTYLTRICSPSLFQDAESCAERLSGSKFPARESVAQVAISTGAIQPDMHFTGSGSECPWPASDSGIDGRRHGLRIRVTGSQGRQRTCNNRIKQAGRWPVYYVV